MLALLGALPIIGNMITAVVNAMFDAKVKIVQAKTGADRDVAITMVKAAQMADHENTTRLGIYASSKIMTMMLIGFAVPLILYFNKVVFIDKVIGPGCVFDYCWLGITEPLKGNAGDWATTIIGFLFGSATVISAGRMYFNRDKS